MDYLLAWKAMFPSAPQPPKRRRSAKKAKEPELHCSDQPSTSRPNADQDSVLPVNEQPPKKRRMSKPCASTSQKRLPLNDMCDSDEELLNGDLFEFEEQIAWEEEELRAQLVDDPMFQCEEPRPPATVPVSVPVPATSKRKRPLQSEKFLTENTYVGLRVTLQSTLEILNYIVQKCNFRYLMASRLNQDNLEVNLIFDQFFKDKTTTRMNFCFFSIFPAFLWYGSKCGRK